MTDVSQWNTTDASNTAAPPGGAPEGWAPSAVNDTVRAIMGALARWYSDSDGTLATGGTGNAYTLTTNSTHAALADQPLMVFRADRANTGAATLNVDSLGAKDLRFNGAALASGAIVANTILAVVYNATADDYDIIGGIGSLGSLGLTDPGADRIVFWDDGAGALAHLQVSTGLTLSGTTLTSDDANINHDALSNFVADEHVAHSGVTLTAGTGLSGGGTIASNRTFNVDISGLTTMSVAPDGADSFLYNDGGTMKQMSYEDVALPTNSVTVSRAFASTDVGHIVRVTSGTVTLTMNQGVGQDNCYLIVVNSAAANVTLASGTATIDSANSLLTIPPGGMATLIRESTSLWHAGGSLQ